MTLAEYYRLIKDVPLPTEDQLAAFARHVADAHSWYKHLDLFKGGDFIVFVDPHAGGAFTEEHSRIHHTWQTRSQYRQRFGHLSYMYRTPGCGYETDYDVYVTMEPGNDGTDEAADLQVAPVLELPPEIAADCGFLLYPFACDNDVLVSRFEDVLAAMERGEVDHPARDLLVRLYQTRRRWLSTNEQGEHAAYLEYDAALQAAFAHEIHKIAAALEALRNHLIAAGCA